MDQGRLGSVGDEFNRVHEMLLGRAQLGKAFGLRELFERHRKYSVTDLMRAGVF
jgi:hypothetical protein